MEQNQYISPIQTELGTPDPQGDFARFNEYLTPDIGIEFEEADIPPIVPFDDTGRETGIAALYEQDDPYEKRLNKYLADQYQEWGPHYREPVTSYYGSNWYDEYKRKLENEMEIAKGIRAPMDR